MIPRYKMNEILVSLLAKSRRGEVFWRDSDSTRSEDESVYEVVSPEFRVTVAYEPSSSVDVIALSIYDSRGKQVGTEFYEDGGDGWQFAADLFAEAQVKVKGWDTLLADIKRAIEAPGPIGLPAQASEVR